jgi:N-acetylmuramoyl-L-alanine amidase
VNKNTADVDGRTVKLDVPPTIKSGRTLVPLRFVAERLGLTVSWDDATRTVTIIKTG